MLTSLGYIFILGITFASIAKKCKLPTLVGMLVAGILLAQFHLLEDSLMNIESQLRTMALVIVLTRAGLSLDLEELKNIGRPAFFMCFIPATFEIIAFGFLGPLFLHLSLVESLLLGSVLGAVSPAVIVPRMLNLMENEKASIKKIPQMILAGASVDDVYVILVFYMLVSILQGEAVSLFSLIQIPVSIVLGLVVGAGMAWLLNRLFNRFQFSTSYQFLLFLSLSFLCLEIETYLKHWLPFSGLLAIMGMGLSLRKCDVKKAENLKNSYQSIWQMAEILLFVLVGAITDIQALQNVGGTMLVVIILALMIRSLGVLICLVGTSLNWKEKVFVVMAYLPKATVQAAIGAIPLSLDFACGEIILCGAVIAILFTAPLGAFLIDTYSKKWLMQ